MNWNDFRTWLLAFTALIAASYGCGRANRAHDRLDVIEQQLASTPAPGKAVR